MNIDAHVIAAAAVSFLGVLSLFILVVATIAIIFFRAAPIVVKLFIFLIIFLSASAFGDSVMHNPNAACTSKDGHAAADQSAEPMPTQ